MNQRDTLFRYLAILQTIPRAPQFLATTTIAAKLEEQDFKVTPRTLQRDLEKLALHFPLRCNKSDKPYRWSFIEHYNSDLPALDTVTALAMVLAEETVAGLLPKVAADRLKPKFKAARQFLDNLPNNGMAQWTQRVRAIPVGKALIPADINPQIWERVTDALLNQSALDVAYLSRSQSELKHYTLHPVGLVARHSVTYLLATVNAHDDVRQFALHRLRSADESASIYRANPDFNVQTYIDQGAFGYQLDTAPVTLQARVSKDVAWLLNETPLSTQQQISEPDAEGWAILTAQVPNDQQTLWWIMGHGAQIDVMEPRSWREHIDQQAKLILQRR